MPTITSSFMLAEGTTVKDLRHDLEMWMERLPDTAEQVNADLSAQARAQVQQIGHGPLAVVVEIAERVGFEAPQMEAAVKAMAGMVRLVGKSLAAFKDAAGELLKDAAREIIKVLGEAVRDLLDSLADLSKLCAAIPVAGWIVAAVIQLVRAAGAVGRLFQSFFDKPKQSHCKFLDIRHWAGPADRNAAQDLLALTDLRFNSGDLTAAFLPPTEPGLRSIEMDAGGHTYIAPPCFAPLLGSALSAWAPYWLTTDAPDTPAKRDSWRAAWFRASYLGEPGPWLRGPWLAGRDGRCEPSVRGDLERMTSTQINYALGYGAMQPISAYPKTDAVAGTLFSQACGVGPFALSVDWHQVGSAWTNAFVSPDPSVGWRYKSGSAGTVGGCPAHWAGLHFDPLENATFIYEPKNGDPVALPFSTSAGPKTGIGQLSLPPDFLDFLFTKSPGLPVRHWPDGFLPKIYTCAQPDATAHGVHTIRYACARLAERQKELARTDAAAYVPELVLQASPHRHILDDTRARILAGGARGIDIDMARSTGGDAWAAAVQLAKKTAFWGTPPPRAATLGESGLELPLVNPATGSGGGGLAVGAMLGVGLLGWLASRS